MDLCVDLFCGLGGWAEGFLSEGYRCIGFDIERHDYGTGTYPSELVIQDVLTLHGSQFRNATVIVASPPCQAYSYRAMPWKRAKALPPPSNELFDTCFRIQREACEAAGRHIPLIVENVCGAQRWVGRAAWHFGSFYLWGDLPALMPKTIKGRKLPGNNAQRLWSERRIQRLRDAEIGTKQGGDWFGKECETSMSRLYGSKSRKRKAASAKIAKIPFPLAQHIARCYKGSR
jgi:C-5 cytosine-specific DNA methylase